MNRGVAMQDSADEGTGMDVQDAAAIMQQARERAEHELRVSYRLLFATYGLLYLIGYGTVWLSVRGQHPYHGPGSTALVVLTLLAAPARKSASSSRYTPTIAVTKDSRATRRCRADQPPTPLNARPTTTTVTTTAVAASRVSTASAVLPGP